MHFRILNKLQVLDAYLHNIIHSDISMNKYIYKVRFVFI